MKRNGLTKCALALAAFLLTSPVLAHEPTTGDADFDIWVAALRAEAAV